MYFITLVWIVVFSRVDITVCSFTRKIQLETQAQRHIVSCVTTIVQKYFPRHGITVSFQGDMESLQARNTSSDLDLLTHFLQTLHNHQQFPIHVSREGGDLEIYDDDQKHGGYVIFMHAHENNFVGDIESQVEDLQEEYHWNVKARFIVVSLKYKPHRMGKVAVKSLSLMWRIYFVSDLIFLASNQELDNSTAEDSQISVYAWTPYHLRNCGLVRRAYTIDTWLSNKSEPYFLNNTKIFNDDRVPKPIKNCTLKVAVSDIEPFVIVNETLNDTGRNYSYSGFEFDILHFIVGVLNLSIEYNKPPKSELTQKEKIQYTIEMTAFRLQDIAFGHYPIDIQIVAFADPVASYWDSTFRWYVPCAKVIPRLQKISQVCTASVWIVICVVLIAATVAMLYIGRRSTSNFLEVELHEDRNQESRTESQRYNTFSDVVYNIWAVALGVSVPEMPVSSGLRSFFLLWVCYSLVMSTVFQAFFTTYLVEPGYDKQIKNLDDLADSDIEFGSHPALNIFYRDSYNPRAVEIYNRSTNCEDYKSCRWKLITRDDFAFLGSDMNIDYFLSGPAKNKQLCVISEIFLSFQLTMYLRKGHPLLRHFNNIVTRMVEAGLVTKFKKDFMLKQRDFYYGSDESSEDFSDNGYFVFTVLHLSIAFYALFLGYILSFMLFLGEYIVNRKCNSS